MVNLEESSLANEIFVLQKNHNLPGFVKEGHQLLEKFSLPNIIDQKQKISKLQWKQRVRKALYEHYGNHLKTQISQYSKLKDGPMASEDFEEKPYLSKMSMLDARTLFRIRCKTNDLQMNQQNNKIYAKNLWKCSECGNIDTQSHIVWCPYFASLREGKSLDNDSDLVNYFTAVFKFREEKANNDE